MTSLETARRTAESSIRECDSHLARLRRSKSLLDPFFPLSVEGLRNAGEEQIEHVDQFIYRFSKLQDSMGTRLLPALHTQLEGSDRPLPFLDILNRLETDGTTPSCVQDWQFFGNLRNNLAHDYPENVEQNVVTLNTPHREWSRMEALYVQVRDYYRRRFPASKGVGAQRGRGG